MAKKRPAKAFNDAVSPAEQALIDWGVDYKLQAGGVIYVPGDIDIRSRNLSRLPDLSRVVVQGNFDCSHNQLVSLKGSPRDVHGNFTCSANRLMTLDGAPQKTGGNFYCGKNNLTSLAHAPVEVGGSFSCGHNPLAGLEGAPQKVGMNFSCGDAGLLSLKGAPSSIAGDFWCRDNLLGSLEHAPTSFGKIMSDFGDFNTWAEVPEEYRISSETRARQAEERDMAVTRATVLSEPLRVGRPLSFRQRNFTGFSRQSLS